MNTLDCKVVSLPTEDKVNIFSRESEIFHSFGIEPQTGHSMNSSVVGLHVYFTSDYSPSESDYVISSNNQLYRILRRANGNLFLNGLGEDYSEDLRKCMRLKKVEATSDNKVYLPSIPKEWLKKYADAKGEIEEVKLEMTPAEEKWSMEYVVYTPARLDVTSGGVIVVCDSLRSQLVTGSILNEDEQMKSEAFGAYPVDLLETSEGVFDDMNARDRQVWIKGWKARAEHS